ncbi:hypothetical protein NG895_21275 [Aeoliella sp. ICT_H6.2]|uniref:Uncharacterized protein n=1 Tax=Aeoliella straminimaris TaxID=2954799 RepID=A0A9X2JJ72_9BACT|nr:hypothetical protein [Aeoliella straminimaris]MCO6046438.1 hypothetical protein [Aeoliella straminimaris]
MNPLKIVSLAALAVTIVPSLLYLGGVLSHDVVLWMAIIGTVCWFATTPLWMDRTPQVDDAEVEI